MEKRSFFIGNSPFNIFQKNRRKNPKKVTKRRKKEAGTKLASNSETGEFESPSNPPVSVFFIISEDNTVQYYLIAVYFLKFTAINAIPISFSTFDFPRTEKRLKRKLAFKNPKTGSTSILRRR